MSNDQSNVVLATSNAGKLAEFRSLLAGIPVELVSVAQVLGKMPAVIEDGETFEENAVKKARAIAGMTSMMTLADDSGLEVDVLGGAPGVRSARYAGERATDKQNNDALLRALRGVPSRERSGRFRCVLCLLDPCRGEPVMILASGACEGLIAEFPRGGGGFGYDPLFVTQPNERTMAELTASEKDSISHRARAMAALRPKLMQMLEDRVVTIEGVPRSS